MPLTMFNQLYKAIAYLTRRGQQVKHGSWPFWAQSLYYAGVGLVAIVESIFNKKRTCAVENHRVQLLYTSRLYPLDIPSEQ